MRNLKLYIIGILCLFTYSLSMGQVSVKSLKKQGSKAFEEERYYDAVVSYEEYLSLRPKKEKVKPELSIALYKTNRVDEALNMMLVYVQDNKNTPGILLYYIARSFHHKEQYDKAAVYYKKYISVGKDKELVEASTAHLIRCASGKRVQRYDKDVFVDNMGQGINTPADELKPILSPRTSERLYFTAEKYDDHEIGRNNSDFPTDIYGTELINGRWSERGYMNAALNTSVSEVLYGFSSDAQIAYYYRGKDRTFGHLYADTFGITTNVMRSRVSLPANPVYGDKDIFFINDSTILFSAIRVEGYGGYDLYFSQKTGGRWSKPQNLGPEVNGPYNECAPYTSKNMDKLIFSSDRTESIGGYDFFITEWNKEQASYSSARNMGTPLNSAGNDLDFIMSDDGITCYFSSDRKSGFGGYDLYTGYFKKSLEDADRITANEIARSLLVEKDNSYDSDHGKKKVTTEYLTFSSALYSDGTILSQFNKNNYDKIASAMLKYPESHLRIQVFSDDKIDQAIGLYFTVKTGEQVVNYLISKGIQASRMHITATGSAYPLAQSKPGNELRNLDRINNRIDFYFSDIENYSLKIQYEHPYVPPAADRNAYDLFNSYNTGLSYRVQIAAYGQRLNSPLLEEEQNALIYSVGDSDLYKYTLGLFKKYEDAEIYLHKLKTKGVTDAFVVAYINGIEKSPKNLVDLSDQYPDLNNFLGQGGEK